MVQEVQQRHGRLYRPSRDGRVFHAMTAVTGVAPGTSIGTTAPFSLHNPPGSGVTIAIQKVVMGYVSGTLGAGVISHCVNTNLSEAVPTGTAITERSAIVGGGGYAAAKGVALTTSTLANAPVPIRPFASLQASLASTAVAPWQIQDDVDGAILLPEGGSYSPQGTTAAGSSPLVVFGVTWEEIPTDVD